MQNAIHEEARRRLSEKYTEPSNSCGQTNRVVMPTPAAQKVVQKGKDDARDFGEKEIDRVQTDSTLQRGGDSWNTDGFGLRNGI